MNNEPVYGNHIGVVVSNEDPEGRNRVQVFVPYVSTTLFDDWNAKQVDIEIGPGTFDKIDAKILARLKLNLPWAEAALPMFGGNGSVSYNKNQEPIVTRSPVISTTPNNKETVFLNQSGAQTISENIPSRLINGGVSSSTASNSAIHIKPSMYGNFVGENAGDINSLFGVGAAGMLQTGDVALSEKSQIYKDLSLAVGKNLQLGDTLEINGQKLRFADKGSSDLEQMNIIDYYKSTSNGSEVDMLISATKSVPINSNTVRIITSEPISPVPSDLNSWINNAKSTGAFEKVMISNGLELRKGSYGYPRGYNGIKKDWSTLLAEVNNQMGNKGNANVLTKYGPAGSGFKAETLSNNNDTTPAASSFKPLQYDPSAALARGSYNNITTPGGVHSKPQIGTMVWVFFYGGDTMRPVYFAGVSEPQSIGRSAG